MKTNERGSHRLDNARPNAVRTRTITIRSTNKETQQSKTTMPQREQTKETMPNTTNTNMTTRGRGNENEATNDNKYERKIQRRNYRIRISTTKRVSESRYDTCPNEPQCTLTLAHPVNTTRRQTMKHDDVYEHVHQRRAATARTR